MNLLFVNPGGRAQGGAEKSLALLIEGLKARGHRCHVLLLADGDAARLFEDAGAEVLIADRSSLGSARRHGGIVRFAIGALTALPGAIATSRMIGQTADALEADIIHSNGFRSHVLTALIRRRRNGPSLVWSLRDRAPHRLHRTLLRLAARRTDLVLANSEFTAELLEGDPVATEVVANPVSLGALPEREAVLAELSLDPSRPVIAVLAHLHPSKGHDVALDATTHLDDLGAQLVVAGGDLYADSADYRRALVAKASRTGCLTFAGNVDSVESIYSAADVVVHPARHPEGFGRVVVEAQLSNTPVVATDLGGVRELIRHGTTGLLVEPDDPTGLAEAIRSLLTDPQRRAHICAVGREAAAAFTVEHHVDRVEAAYAALRSAEHPGCGAENDKRQRRGRATTPTTRAIRSNSS